MCYILHIVIKYCYKSKKYHQYAQFLQQAQKVQAKANFLYKLNFSNNKPE